MGSGIYACLWLGKQNGMELEEKIAKLLKMTIVSSSTSYLFYISDKLWQIMIFGFIWDHVILEEQQNMYMITGVF